MMMTNEPSGLLATNAATKRIISAWGNDFRQTQATMTVKSHPRQYRGNLLVEDYCLIFRGQDLLEEEYCDEIIPFEKIIDVILPFDEGRHVLIDPWGYRDIPVPFIVRYQIDNEERTVYFNT